MTNPTPYLDDVLRYDNGANPERVKKIAIHLGIALRNRDSSLVSCSDQKEKDRVQKGFCFKKLGMDKGTANAAIALVCETMKADRNKHRVTFYYLLAKNAGKLSDL